MGSYRDPNLIYTKPRGKGESTLSKPFEAKFESKCVRCSKKIYPGEKIVMVGPGKAAHETH